MVITLNGVYQSMDLTKASIHDIHFLEDVKQSKLTNCLLLADKRYLSSEQQIDLFYSAGIELQTPMRRNQHGYQPWAAVFKTA